MTSIALAVLLGGWRAPPGTSTDYAVVARGRGAIVRRVAAQTTYLGPYGDQGIATAVVDATPYRAKRIVVAVEAAHLAGSGSAGITVDVWGPEGLLTGGFRAARSSREAQAPARFVLDVPSDAAEIRVNLSLSGDGEASIDRAELNLAPPGLPATARVFVTPIDGAARAELAAALRPIAVSFRTPSDGMAAVSRAVSGARIIGMAESAHGSASEDERAAELFRWFALHDGVRVLAVEMMFATARRLDDYVGGAPEDVDDALRQSNFYAFQTPTFARLLAWMRDENLRRPAARRLHVVGVDMQYVGPQRNFVLRRLDAVDRAAAEAAKRDYACVMLGAAGPIDRTCLEHLRAATARVREVFAPARGADEEHAARDVEQYAEQQLGVTTRDQSIAENVEWAADTRFAGMRVAVWAHFFHLAGACCLGHPTAAHDLAKRYGDGYYALGLLFGSGVVRAIPAGGAEPRAVAMPPGSPNTLEAVLDDVGDDYFVDLRAARIPAAARARLAEPHRLRRVDLWTDPYRPETTWTDERLTDALDGFIYLRTTVAPDARISGAAPGRKPVAANHASWTR